MLGYLGTQPGGPPPPTPPQGPKGWGAGGVKPKPEYPPAPNFPQMEVLKTFGNMADPGKWRENGNFRGKMGGNRTECGNKRYYNG